MGLLALTYYKKQSKISNSQKKRGNLRCEIMVNIICGYNNVLGAIIKVPVIRDVWAAVVISLEYIDHAHHRPLAAGALLTVQPDLNTRQLLNDLYNHWVGRLRAQPVTSRNCRRIANHTCTVRSLNVIHTQQYNNAFRHQLKTWLSISLFWTSSSDTDCILTFSLGLSVPTLRRFCHIRTTMWYDMRWHDMIKWWH